MNPHKKILLCVSAYCILLWLTNWSSSTVYDRDQGLTAESLDMRGAGITLGIIFSIVFLRRIYLVMRILMESSVRIPKDLKFLSGWSYLALLLPLLYGYSHHKDSIVEGVKATTIFQYGGDLSAFSLLFSGIAIMLFQFLVRLESFNPENRAFDLEQYRTQ